jgi:hypothetical protein
MRRTSSIVSGTACVEVTGAHDHLRPDALQVRALGHHHAVTQPLIGPSPSSFIMFIFTLVETGSKESPPIVTIPRTKAV